MSGGGGLGGKGRRKGKRRCHRERDADELVEFELLAEEESADHGDDRGVKSGDRDGSGRAREAQRLGKHDGLATALTDGHAGRVDQPISRPTVMVMVMVMGRLGLQSFVLQCSPCPGR